DRLHQAALDRGVDVEGGGLGDRLVPAVEYRVDLRQRDALHGDGDLDEVAGLAAQVRQSFKAAHFPRRRRNGEAQLRHRERPGEIAEVALLLDVLGDVDLIQMREVVVHGETPW